METQAEDKVFLEQTDLDKVLEKINEIAKKSADGVYIYRGEPECYDKVSSSLYREYLDIEAEHFEIAVVQADILKAAHEYTFHEMEDLELLATLQHLGDNTNLIDFTTDSFVALFFACDGSHEDDGRVILLRRQPESDPKAYEVVKPPKTTRRAEAQKSIFVQAPTGFLEPDRIVTIPADLKSALLDYLRNHHDISNKTIYNDLQGFIEKRGLHKNMYTEFYKGFTSQGRADAAKTEVERQKCYNDAITRYTTAITLNPEYAEAYNNRGITYDNKGEFNAAIQDYTKAIELNPELAEAYNNRGNAYGRKGEFDAAIQDYTKAIGLNPEYANAYNNRGSVYDDTGEFDAAIQDYNKAIDLNSKDARFYNNRGITYANTGEFDAAIQDYMKAIELNSEYANAYNNRGTTYSCKVEFDAAIQDYTKAIALNPEDANVYYNRGTTYGRKGEFDAAIQDFNKAIALNSKDADAYNNRGVVYYKKGEFDAAIQDFNKAIALKLEDASAYHNRGEALLHLSKWEKAKADLITAKDMGFDIVEAFHNDYESVEAFETKTGINLPEDIAALLRQA